MRAGWFSTADGCFWTSWIRKIRSLARKAAPLGGAELALTGLNWLKLAQTGLNWPKLDGTGSPTGRNGPYLAHPIARIRCLSPAAKRPRSKKHQKQGIRLKFHHDSARLRLEWPSCCADSTIPNPIPSTCRTATRWHASCNSVVRGMRQGWACPGFSMGGTGSGLPAAGSGSQVGSDPGPGPETGAASPDRRIYSSCNSPPSRRPKRPVPAGSAM